MKKNSRMDSDELYDRAEEIYGYGGKMNKQLKKEVNQYISYGVKWGWIDDEAEKWTDEEKLKYFNRAE